MPTSLPAACATHLADYTSNSAIGQPGKLCHSSTRDSCPLRSPRLSHLRRLQVYVVGEVGIQEELDLVVRCARLRASSVT